MKSMPDGRLLPTPGDAIALDVGRLVAVKTSIRKYACSTASADERRHGCYWVVGGDDEEYVVTADVSGLRSQAFRICSGVR